VKVAIVAPQVTAINEPQRGGSQAFVSDLARGLTRRGHDVHVYAASGSDIPGAVVIDTRIDPESLAATLYRASGTPVLDPPGPGPAAPGPGPAEEAFASVYARVRATRYDVVHNHAFDAPAVTLATGLDAPVVHTLHLPPDQAVAAALGQASRDGQRPAVATVSESAARLWREVLPVDAILPPLVPTASIGWSRSAGSGAVFGGRLSPEKGAAQAMSMASAAPFSGLSLPANTAPSPASGDQGMTRVGGYGGRIASTGTIRRQAIAWDCDTAATAGDLPRRAAWRSAAATARSGGRWSVCTTGARRSAASRMAGASKA